MSDFKDSSCYELMSEWREKTPKLRKRLLHKFQEYESFCFKQDAEVVDMRKHLISMALFEGFINSIDRNVSNELESFL